MNQGSWQCRLRSDCSWKSCLIRVYTVCHSICIFWMHYCMVESHCYNFRIITATVRLQFYVWLFKIISLILSWGNQVGKATMHDLREKNPSDHLHAECCLLIWCPCVIWLGYELAFVKLQQQETRQRNSSRDGGGGVGEGQGIQLFLGKHVRPAPLKNHPIWAAPKLKYQTLCWVSDCEKTPFLTPFYNNFVKNIPFSHFRQFWYPTELSDLCNSTKLRKCTLTFTQIFWCACLPTQVPWAPLPPPAERGKVGIWH